MSNGKVPIYDYEQDERAYENTAAWFLGPKAENHGFMEQAFGLVVDRLLKARKAYKPDDPDYITEGVMSSGGYQQAMQKTFCLLDELSKYMSKHNIPFYSPRYAAHMNGDTTLPATLGYLLGMLYNPNNVSAEASPLTTMIEYEVGQDLCKMLGYQEKKPKPWGHITCDGSVANLESMWVARNLKFYPLSLKNAMAPGGPLNRIAESFQVTLCGGGSKLFNECSTWELLNLTPDTVLDLERRVTQDFGFSKKYYQKVMGDHIIQTISKDSLLSQYGIEPPQYFVATTKHYSWPKGAAITGIGSENLIEVRVDNNARMDPAYLEQLLEDRLQRKQAVYAVVAIIGSTEHGSVDPLDQIVYLREKFQKKGLSFVIHADAAWGGYFASLLRDIPPGREYGTPVDPIVIRMGLPDHTKKQLESLKYADSITTDPHKPGYIPYPAGSLCYRDERMTSLVTWTTPYIGYEAANTQTMGIYGLEGSKPGAAPVAVWLSHAAIGLHKGGYGSLLGQAMFTAVKMYCRWATMSTEGSNLIVVPLNMLPSEQRLHPTTAEVEEEKRFIREKILNLSNRDLLKDEKALAKLQLLGSDLMINAFACNFRVDGVANTSVAEANVLNAEIYEALSVYHVSGDVKERDVFLMSTVLSQKQYGECLTNFKRRLGLLGDEDLFVLSNVSTSPFLTANQFDGDLADVVKRTAEEVIAKICVPRNRVYKAKHSFLIQGTDRLHLVYLPVLPMATHRQQLIMTVDLPAAAMRTYLRAQEQDPTAFFCLHTAEEVLLSDILRDGSFQAQIEKRIPEKNNSIGNCGGHIFELPVKVVITRIIVHRPLDPHLLDSSYPKQMPFYLYGTSQRQHIDHILLSSPNVQLSASDITLKLAEEASSGFKLEAEIEQGLVAVFDEVPEAEMQPFDEILPPSFFSPRKEFAVTIRRGGPDSGLHSAVVARGTLTLGSKVFIDFDMLNKSLVEIIRGNRFPKEDIDKLEKFLKDKELSLEHIESHEHQSIISNGGHTILSVVPLQAKAKTHQNDGLQQLPQMSAFRAPWRLNV